MHILLTNDDGKPSEHSPFIECFGDFLRRAGHRVTVIVPLEQQSWTGKCVSLKPVALSHCAGNQDTQSVQSTQDSRGILDSSRIHCLSGTPATCVNIALCHLTHADLVIVGPNFGRNTGTASALSSGTVGAAIEAALLGTRAIALSFAYASKADAINKQWVYAACSAAIHTIDRILSVWDSVRAIALFSVNLALGHDYRGIVVTRFHSGGYRSLYKRQGDSFVFEPTFEMDNPAAGSDVWAIQNGYISVTPLDTCFQLSDCIQDLKEKLK